MSGRAGETGELEDTVMADDSSLSPSLIDAQQELARYLSPENQNVKNGDLVGMARDLAQIKVTALDNYREVERLLEAAIERCEAAESRAEAAEAQLAALSSPWQLMETMPEQGQVIVAWPKGDYDTIGRAEYLEIMGYGEPPALGWMPIPKHPALSKPV